MAMEGPGKNLPEEPVQAGVLSLCKVRGAFLEPFCGTGFPLTDESPVRLAWFSTYYCQYF